MDPLAALWKLSNPDRHPPPPLTRHIRIDVGVISVNCNVSALYVYSKGVIYFILKDNASTNQLDGETSNCPDAPARCNTY